MNALIDYFFPTSTPEVAPAPAPPAPAPPAPKNPSVCFTRGSDMYILRLSDVETMNEADLKKYRQWVLAHVYETYDPEQCDAGHVILDAIDKRLKKMDSDVTSK